jgi:ferritin-like metal-binding protein YciE
MNDNSRSSNQNGQNRQNNSDMPNAQLHELFVDELRDIMGGERQLLRGLKKLAGKAKSETLRLKEVMQSLGMSGRGKKCKAMEGLLNEAEEIADEFEDSEILDAALIAAAQKVEHYEIASYGCLVTYAQLMKHEEAAQTLAKTLDEEKETDVKLTKIAMSESNFAETSGAGRD